MRIIIVTLALALLSSCSMIGSLTTSREAGNFWCNERYLHDMKYPPFPNETSKHLEIAEKGYIYALASTLVLQGQYPDDLSQESKDHFFQTPSYLEIYDWPKSDTSGFEVGTFKLYETSDKTKLKEIIIAFTGSDQKRDWVFTNLLFSKKQYKLAREYVTKIAEANPNTTIVVAGYSLGAGLAVHVIKDPSTKKYISQAWAFNPSPKIYADGEEDEDIWLASTGNEMLKMVRSPFFYKWPGVDNIGAPKNQTADEYNRIKSWSIYSHYRWVLTRNMLWAADLSIYNRTKADMTEPLKIIKNSSFKSCEQ
ncbi:cutinase family protein [Psychrobacter sp. NPDC078370]|uniref:cutinase family protein n=1 Tax=unclassified Psychrobacter TaxID=196806 RepID=UPI000C7EC672|nr:cutinase family protein [Psychrobacter sp. MES7-P7E]PLT22055.1 hypothetical protein CXF62_07245 [Psychrobacter sp. MES7-P7E]